jgi:hypothetical protein
MTGHQELTFLATPYLVPKALLATAVPWPVSSTIGYCLSLTDPGVWST